MVHSKLCMFLILVSLTLHTSGRQGLALAPPKTSVLPYRLPCGLTWPALPGSSSFLALGHSRPFVPKNRVAVPSASTILLGSWVPPSYLLGWVSGSLCWTPGPGKAGVSSLLCSCPAPSLPTALPWFDPDPTCPSLEWTRFLASSGLPLDCWYSALCPHCHPMLRGRPQVLSSHGLPLMGELWLFLLLIHVLMSPKPSTWAVLTIREFRAFDRGLGLRFMCENGCKYALQGTSHWKRHQIAIYIPGLVLGLCIHMMSFNQWQQP